MINNRQAGRRNRGRNNGSGPGRPQGGNNRGGGDSGNRIDNRARGNATQLLEKYRNMARDAQLAGDRVNAEYCLQFADHYFRVLADNRARQEEQQQRYRQPGDAPQSNETFEDEGDDYFGNDDGMDEFRPASFERTERPAERQPERGNDRNGNERNDRAGNDRQDRNDRAPERNDRQDRNDRPERAERQERAERPERAERQDRPARTDRNEGDRYRQDGRNRQDRPRFEPAAQPAPVAAEAPAPVVEAATPAPIEEAPKPRRGRPPRVRPVEAPAEESLGLDMAALPPPIGRADNDSDPAKAEAPRKRTRRARPATEAAE